MTFSPRNHIKPTLTRSISALLAALVLWICNAAAAEPPTVEEFKNLIYTGIYDKPVALKDGVYEGEPFVEGGASRPRVELVEQPYVLGDLDANGVEDAAVLLNESSGGSGVYTYLAVVARRDGQLENIATRRIGDRVQIRALRFDQGTLIMELVTTGPEEPACCPTLKQRNTFQLEGSELVEVASEELGTLSLADLEGTTWTLTHFAQNEPVPENIEITAQFTAGRVSGSSGCNQYFASISGSGPQDITIGPAGSTRMACPPPVMQVETRYLRALEKVRQFSFQLGRLALTYQDGDTGGTMLFTPSQ